MLAKKGGDAAEHRVAVAEHREDVIKLLSPLESNDDVFPARSILLHCALDCLLEAFGISVGLREELKAAILEEVDQGLLDKLALIGEVSLQLHDSRSILGSELFKRSFELIVKPLFLLGIRQGLSRGVLNKLDRIGFLRSDVDFFISGVRLAEQDVLLDGGVEEHWLLHDISTLLAQGQYVIVVKIFTVDQNLTLFNVVETEQDISQG